MRLSNKIHTLNLKQNNLFFGPNLTYILLINNYLKIVNIYHNVDKQYSIDYWIHHQIRKKD